MILRNSNMKSFFEMHQNKKIVCYGIGADFDRILKNFSEYPWGERIGYLVDNSPSKWGNIQLVDGYNHKVISLEAFLKEDVSNTVILITCSFYAEIIEQLNAISKLDLVECYIYYFMFALSEEHTFMIKQREECLIPQVIHYCWFGGKELPDLYKRCIDSWYKHCPEYQIIEWNESNCNLEENLFAKQAYEVGKYGFVPDYFRLKIIYEHGGIYLDTDVELVKNLDSLRYNEAFCGMELPGEAALGLGFGAISHHSVIKKMLERYDKMQFIKEDGTYEETASPVWQTKDLLELGMQYGNRLQEVSGMTIYPTEVLSPKSVITGETNLTEYSYAIHHYDGSWVTGERLKKKLIRQSNVRKIQDLMKKNRF